MGTTSDKLVYLNSTKAAIKAAINALPNGPYIEDGATFRSYEHAVEAAGVGCMVAATDEAAWYILSPSKMFTDRAGTTPVTALDDFVGLIMDSSQGQGLGAEINSDVSFDDAAQWVVPAECSISGGVATITNPTGSRAFRDSDQSTVSEAGSVYEITFTVISNTGLNVVVYAGGATKSLGALSGGTYTQRLAASTSGVFLGLGTTTGTGVVSFGSFSVKKVQGNHFTAVSDAGRALYKTDGTDSWIQLDKVDDNYSTTFASPIVGTMLIGTRKGTIHIEVNIPAGAWSLTPNAAYFPGNTVTDIIIKNGYMTTAELANAKAWLESRGSPVVYTPTGSDLANGFRTWGVLTSAIKNANLSGVTNMVSAYTNNALSELDSGFLNGATLISNMGSMLANNTTLTTVAAGVFDTQTVCTAYSFCFTNTNLTQQSIDNVLVSIAASYAANSLTGGTFNQSGGSAPSATGNAAIDALRAAGMTVTVTGGY